MSFKASEGNEVRFYMSTPGFLLRLHKHYWYLFKIEELFTVILIRYYYRFSDEIIKETLSYLLLPGPGKYLGGNRDYLDDIVAINDYLIDKQDTITEFLNNQFYPINIRDEWVFKKISFDFKSSIEIIATLAEGRQSTFPGIGTF